MNPISILLQMNYNHQQKPLKLFQTKGQISCSIKAVALARSVYIYLFHPGDESVKITKGAIKSVRFCQPFILFAISARYFATWHIS